MNLFIFIERGRIISEDVLRNECNTNSFVLLSEDVQSFKIYNEWAILGASIYIVNFQEHT